MAYNEEANIANAINAILAAQSRSGELAELIVVASGCSDRTADIVAALARDDARIHLVIQEQRAGKASAINLFITEARSPILLMVNGDNIVGPGAIDALVEHFHDPAVGMVGGHPVPVNDHDTFLGYAVHLLWRMHDRIARESPKLGEIVAFRNVVRSIPTDTAVDEISIQAVVTDLGLRLVYEPRAIVYNRGPSTVRDFLAQRRRIYAGHLRIARQQGYSASTMSVSRVSRVLLRSEVARIVRIPFWLAGAAFLEVAARALGCYDVVRSRPHHIWTAVESTKGDIAEGLDRWEENVLPLNVVGVGRNQGARAPLAEQSPVRVPDGTRLEANEDEPVIIVEEPVIIASPSSSTTATKTRTQRAPSYEFLKRLRFGHSW
jgi:poly-beta-1,6-N-acetyl-D-glucosamine synthase